MDKDTRILIVGAGCFGTSTAYHLSQRGYTSIRVLDPYASPSCEAASTDISKVIRSDYNEPLYARLGIESIEAWRSWPLFRGLYHVPRWILSAANLSRPFVEGSIETWMGGISMCGTQRLAIERMAGAAQLNGVNYISGKAKGHVQELILDDITDECEGVITTDGTRHEADVVIVAAGAWTPSLLDVKGQLTAKGYSVAHIQLTPSETKHYASMPIMDNLELGYFFPPQEGGIFKMTHSQFITNIQTTKSGITTSVPHTFVQAPDDGLPLEIEAQMRRNLRRVFPELANKPFCYTRLCWDAETADRHFLVTPHPTHKVSSWQPVAQHTGLSSFLSLENLLEGTLDPEIVSQWQWRAGQKSTAKDLAHLDPEMELSDLTGWKGRQTRERSYASNL
ncbi:FAD dependent oxidoreductase [Penicillium cf. griseofulvum]|uniref:FAD dependent oxidoreductase n=1 Tax=Penicillium cf. griseofulvum TaxID=2972120 RepID=A0A9W9JHC3_9EURO|nr:FAD dependent oxidoreductase [Penicillium cf. griseofulvum]KAJ5445642.1 FAD dependent oxidoreductase [Penicillium cf. griseofulvum]